MPSESGLIVSGMCASSGSVESGAGYKVIVGGGGTVVFPVIQQCSYISLECLPITLDPLLPMSQRMARKSSSCAAAQVKVVSDPVAVLMAAEAFLDQPEAKIAERVSEIILGHTRAIVGTMSYSELLHDLHGLCCKVSECTDGSLAKFGMKLVSFSIDEMENNSAQLQSLVFEAAMKS